MDVSYLESPVSRTRMWDSPKEKAKIWDSDCFKYSLISLVALAALACIVLGAIAYSGAGLVGIGTKGGIALMATGSSLLGIGILALYLSHKGLCKFPTVATLLYPRISTDEALRYTGRLGLGEFFVFDDIDGEQRMTLLNHPCGNIDPYPTFYHINYSNYQKSYKEISLEELKSRFSPDY